VPPGEVVLDTSFVVDALVPSQVRHEECQRFLAALVDANATVVYNRLLEAELWEAAYGIALQELHPGKPRKTARRDGRSRRRAKRLRGEVATAWTDVLDNLNSIPIEVGEVAGLVPTQMEYGLKSYDAVHVATAIYAATRAFVASDYEFSFVPRRDLDLYIVSGKVAACRLARP
jgi:predicted nucleic acid-binding protein